MTRDPSNLMSGTVPVAERCRRTARRPRILRDGCLAALVAVLAWSGPAYGTDRQLPEGFVRPPDSARPHTWWHWMNGMVTRKGITLDLEAMKEVGLGGVQAFHVTDGIPPGPVGYMTPEWRKLFRHTVREAARVGLELCIHDCAGWSSSGGPWITPEYSMKVLTWTETRVRGPKPFDAVLPQPKAKMKFYRDIAVLAFPEPPAERSHMRQMRPEVRASRKTFAGTNIVDGNIDTWSVLPKPAPGRAEWFELDFPKPFRACGAEVVPGPGRSGHHGFIEVSDDGRTWRRIHAFTIPASSAGRSRLTAAFDPVEARRYRFVFDRAGARTGRMTFAEVTLTAGMRISDWRGKAGFVRHDRPRRDTRTAPADAVVHRQDIRDLTPHMQADGRLRWNVPAGNWVLLRVGYTTTGKTNHPTPEEGRGLECDKLNRAAMDVHWRGLMDKVLADAGPLAGKTFNNVLIDSYEVGAQNWAQGFRDEFRKRCGYDILPFLVVMAGGRVVDSVDVSERFLWDLRRVLADLFDENYYGYFADLAHRHGLLFSTEPYGNGNFDNLQVGGRADIPMAEFWVGHGSGTGNAKQAASIGHTYGRTFIGAEAFTADSSRGGWRNHPFALKRLGDLMFCAGINRFIFHEYAMQPWTNLLPGMTMGPHGFHFNRCITWWKQAPAWISYLTRCQYMLQQGRFVADLCYYNGEDAPSGLPDRGGLRPRPPEGYDYDGCDARVLLERMKVAPDGRIVLPDGMSWRVLVLPPTRAMRPRILRKIRDLVRAGATVIGPKPDQAPGLSGYPASDEEVRRLADEVWGDCDGKKVTSHRYGRGMVYWGVAPAEVLGKMGVGPDVEVRGLRTDVRLAWIHRRTREVDWYFVSNQRKRFEPVDVSFRVAGREVEFWDPATGRMQRAAQYRQAEGRTTVRLLLDPWGSVFVVFRRPASAAPTVVTVRYGKQDAGMPRLERPVKIEIVKAVYGVLHPELPDMVDVTRQLSARIRNGRLVIRADNSIAGDPARNIVKQLRVEYVLDGKPGVVTVDENHILRLPADGSTGHDLIIRRALYGVIPEDIDEPRKKKLTVDVTDALRKMVRDGKLSVPASNSIAGDPAPLIVKELRVEYRVDGRLFAKTVREGRELSIPEEPLNVRPAGEVVAAASGGAPLLRAWTSGRFEVEWSSGRRQTVTIPAAAFPDALKITGPWTVTFPPGLGAPESVRFPKLISWTDHPDDGVKYFSGTARYETRFSVPGEVSNLRNVRWFLDLGDVRNIAEVRLNGRSFGVLWKPPFRIDVTGAVRAGGNVLEIAVTNNWPNRLIGDEHLPPDDRKWRGQALAGWPKWVLEGKPRPKTRRITWTTWRHYSADSPLFESGLLGPVRLLPAVENPLRPGE